MTDTDLLVRVATANQKRAGYNRATRRHEHDKLAAMLSPLPEHPHALYLSECTHYSGTHYEPDPLEEVLRLLGSLWARRGPDGRKFGEVPYRAYISEVPGSVNVPGLFIDPRTVVPRRRYPLVGSRAQLANTVTATINGHKWRLKCVHWNGSRGETGLDQQADQDGQMASENALYAGDFNATSSATGETVYENWGALCDEVGRPWMRSQKGRRRPDGTWGTNTGSIDRFLEHGWWDAGQVANDFTETTTDPRTALRIDRIMLSRRSPACFAPELYRVHQDPPLSVGGVRNDHRMVSVGVLVRAAA
ncbi:hypothetical protein CFP71_28160 [Amycolatopsis thailandensis]|uniref:Endonuclease/exonuclease/phosphatase domain-containing protein n=1 Tax=Amycolatopsis thailandensis TaxID=589330 RepID=A0A229RUF5_9PSEU|nr:hypothetical protein [Amycolatopsis thailandensis]OXM50308.1 hypothetical protein CFP71_28160 [Amycolatopsis thailandensis]